MTGDDPPTIGESGFEEPDADVQRAGTEAARGRLAAFCDGPIYGSERARDRPAEGATSQPSADLNWGTIGVREVCEATAETREGRGGDEDDSAEAFQSRLAWREFYTQALGTSRRW